MLARRVQFLRFNDIPVRLVSNNARIITGYIAKFNPKENLILASDKPKEGANKRGNSSRLTQSFHFFMFEPIFSPVNALNQPI